MSKKIALTNMDIVWEDKEANKFQCEEMIKEAADEHADIILFPEMTLTGFSLRVKEMADYHEETIAYFSALAAKYSIMIGFGYITMPDEFGRNHFCFVDENGSVLADYEKIHPFAHGGETKAYRGGGEICHISVDEMHLGMAVCYDLRFPEMFQQMPLDTNVIFLIANWPESRIRQWYSLLTARAIEMSSYVVGVNRTGEGDGIQYTKSSAAYAPDGSMISPDSKKWNDYVTLDFSKEVFQKTIFSRSDRRPEIYQG